jgi:hypothetical protein
MFNSLHTIILYVFSAYAPEAMVHEALNQNE